MRGSGSVLADVSGNGNNGTILGRDLDVRQDRRSVLTDVSGKGNTGTISGATWTSAGKSGGALTFEGVNDLVTIADASSLDLTNGMTLEAWVRRTATGSWRPVLTKEQPGNVVDGLFSDSDTAQAAGIVSIGPLQDIVRATSPQRSRAGRISQRRRRGRQQAVDRFDAELDGSAADRWEQRPDRVVPGRSTTSGCTAARSARASSRPT